MISSKNIEFDLKKIRRNTTTQHRTCYSCKNFIQLTKGNPKKLIDKIKINKKHCTCIDDTHIFIYKKTKKPKYNNREEIAELFIRKISNNIYEIHSNIWDEKYLNKGLGIYLYSLGADWAIRHGVTLYSSRQTSEYAKRVWRSKRLKEMYKISYHPSMRRWSIKRKIK